jgi:NADH:ubiquinone oxidoreductase subunit K
MCQLTQRNLIQYLRSMELVLVKFIMEDIAIDSVIEDIVETLKTSPYITFV